MWTKALTIASIAGLMGAASHAAAPLQAAQPQLSAECDAHLRSWLHTILKNREKAKKPKGGRVSLRNWPRTMGKVGEVLFQSVQPSGENFLVTYTTSVSKNLSKSEKTFQIEMSDIGSDCTSVGSFENIGSRAGDSCEDAVAPQE